jgi:DNA-binding NtrC family response regulator
LKRLLKPSFECEGAADGEAAQRLIRGDAFALVLLDLDLPKVDGFQVLEHIKEHRPLVPVVIVSADARPDSIITAKPFEDARGLTGRLQRAVSQALSPKAVSELLLVLEDERRPLPRYTDARQIVLAQFQRTYLERLMKASSGNLSAASRLSGIDRANLRRALG